MSQPKIISLKDHEGKVYSSIVPTKDGRWLEIKIRYSFKKDKMILDSEEQWLRRCGYDENKFLIVRNEREPYTRKAKTEPTAELPKNLSDTEYLLAIATKYKRKMKPVEKKRNLVDKAKGLEMILSRLEHDFNHCREEAFRSHLETKIRKLEEVLATMRKRIEEKHENTPHLEYKNLTKQNTFAYIQTDVDEFVPIGFFKTDDTKEYLIVFKNKVGKSFSDLGFTNQPTVWLWYKNTFMRAK